MIHKTNIHFDPIEAYEYYQILCRDFKHLHWGYLKDHNDPKFTDPKNKIDDMNGWGLQTIYNDPLFPYHCDLDPHDEGPIFFKPTPLIFGFAERLLALFQSPYRACLYVHPPKSHIDKWMAGGPPHGKIVVPISTNASTLLTSHNLPPTKIVPLPGNIYLVETNVEAEIINNGLQDDVFISFNVPIDTFSAVLDTKGII